MYVGGLRQPVWTCRIRSQRVVGEVRESYVVVIRIGIASGRRAQHGASIRWTEILFVVGVGADHENSVRLAGRCIDAHVIPALAGAEIKGGIAGVAQNTAGQRFPAAGCWRASAGNDRSFFGDEG